MVFSVGLGVAEILWFKFCVCIEISKKSDNYSVVIP